MIKLYRNLLYLLSILILSGCNLKTIDNKENLLSNTDENLDFYVVTDIHYLSDEINDYGEAFEQFVNSGDGKQLKYVDELLEGFIYNIKESKPEILIVSGDLTNNGEKVSHLELAKKFQVIEENGTNVFVIPGNHDISNPWARGFEKDKQYVTESISPEEFTKIYENYGYSEALSKDDDSLSYLVEASKDIWLLMLDSNKYKNNTKLGYPQGDGELSAKTINWIKSCIDMAKDENVILIPVMHHNILNHNDVIRWGFTLNNNNELIDLFKNHNISIVLSGHIHVQDISSNKENGQTLYDIATGSFAVYPHQYGMFKYSKEDNSLTYSTKEIDLSSWADDKKITDENINNFSEYSRMFFENFAYNMATKNLSEYNNFSEYEKELMVKTMTILNSRYFAGKENLNLEDLIETEGFKLWESMPDSFMKKYVISISIDNDTEDNYLQLNLNKLGDD